MNKLVALAVFTLAGTAGTASARNCNLFDPQLTPGLVPLGCPITIFSHPDITPANPRLVIANRDVTGTVTRAQSTLSVGVLTFNPANCQATSTQRDELIDVTTIEVVGAADGDVVTLAGTSAFTRIGPPASCPTPAPNENFFCDEDSPCAPRDNGHDDLDEDGGCSTGAGGAGWAAIGLALLAVQRRRRATGA